MDLQDYLRILRTHWKVIASATVIGALLGGLLGFLNRPDAEPADVTPFASTVDLTLLSEKGRRDLADRLSDLTSTTARADLAIENPNPDRTAVDYTQRLLSRETRERAAAATDQQVEDFDGRITATANPETETITLTVEGVGSEATTQETEALIAAFDEIVGMGEPMDSTGEFLITTQTPNPDLQTSAGYTESRMPTYAALATSNAVIDPAARELGIGADELRTALDISIKPSTSIMMIGVLGGSGLPDSADPTQAISAVAENLQSAIESIETTPVTFQDLGASSQDTGTRVRTLALSVSEPQVLANADGSIPPATIASTLTNLTGEIPTTLASSTAAITDPLSTDELEQLSAEVASETDSISVDITPLTQVEGITDSPLNATSIRLTARAASAEAAEQLAAAAVGTIEDRIAASEEPQPWPLALTPTPVVAITEVTASTAAAAAAPVDRTTTNIILGLLIGLALGVGYAFLMSSRDKTIYSPRQLWEATGEPAFGVIPTQPPASTWAAVDEHDLGGEGYRALRSNVMLGLKDTTVLALVSPVTGTGTKTVGVNLAISLAQAGSRVCVVETALSAPTLAEQLSAQQVPGLANVITGQADLGSSIQRIESLGFDLLTAGETTNDVTDTLTSKAFGETIDQLRERYDTVLLLCSPAVESAEASAVTPLSDATLIIIRVTQSSMTDLEITARVLLQVGTKIAGIIANDVPHEHTDQWRRYLPMGNPQTEATPN